MVNISSNFAAHLNLQIVIKPQCQPRRLKIKIVHVVECNSFRRTQWFFDGYLYFWICKLLVAATAWNIRHACGCDITHFYIPKFEILIELYEGNLILLWLLLKAKNCQKYFIVHMKLFMKVSSLLKNFKLKQFEEI